MSQKKDSVPANSENLLHDLKSLIEQGRSQAVAAVNSALTITYWQVGRRINEEILHGQRAEYGKQVVVSLAEELSVTYGKSFEARNLRRMMQFAEVFPDFEIVSPLVSQLSWTHFTVLMSLPNSEARGFYAQHTTEGKWRLRNGNTEYTEEIFIERGELCNPRVGF